MAVETDLDQLHSLNPQVKVLTTAKRIGPHFLKDTTDLLDLKHTDKHMVFREVLILAQQDTLENWSEESSKVFFG